MSVAQDIYRFHVVSVGMDPAPARQFACMCSHPNDGVFTRARRCLVDSLLMGVHHLLARSNDDLGFICNPIKKGGRSLLLNNYLIINSLLHLSTTTGGL